MSIYQLPEELKDVPLPIAMALAADRPELLCMASSLNSQDIPCLVNVVRVLMIHNQQLRQRLETVHQWTSNALPLFSAQASSLRQVANDIDRCRRKGARLLPETETDGGE